MPSKNARIGMAVLLVAIALVAGLASGLGVFARGDGSKADAVSIRGEHYEYVTTGVYKYNAERVVSEGVGWDWVTLFMIVPALLVTVPFVARGSMRGRLVAAGLLGALFYQYFMYALMYAISPLFLAFVPLYSASLAGIVWLGSSIPLAQMAEEFAPTFPRRAMAVFNFAMAALLTLLWSQRISLALHGDLTGAALFGMPTLSVQALDLGIIVPLSVFTAVLALQRKPIGYLLCSIFIVKGFALATGIAGMLVSAAFVEGALEIPPFAIFVTAALASLALALKMYRVPKTGRTGAPAAHGSAA